MTSYSVKAEEFLEEHTLVTVHSFSAILQDKFAVAQYVKLY